MIDFSTIMESVHFFYTVLYVSLENLSVFDFAK